ncbi:MAG: diaminopimelate decarboxylase [Chloroflexota bacterium]
MTHWWERADLRYENGRLQLGQQDLQELAEVTGMPTFAYHMPRVTDNLNRLKAALAARNVPHKVFFALKSNRFLPLVTYLKLQGGCGVDLCSPNELLLARQVGFREEEMTYTNTAVSSHDLDILAKHPNVNINCDAVSMIRRLGERCPGREIGIRINPEVGVGYNQGMEYAGKKTTKFGIYRAQFAAALAMAKKYDMRVTTLHFHAGSGYLQPQVGSFANVLAQSNWFLDQCPDVVNLNIGGGLGLRLVESDEAINLEAWADVVAQHAHARGVTIHLEPGDYLVKDAGVLLLQVNMVERKKETLFVGVNGGFNLHVGNAYYQTPYIIAPLIPRGGELHLTTVSGHINEAIDIWDKDIMLPPLAEEDYLALLNVGGYGSSMSSNHCMRGEFSEYLIL